MQPSWPTRPRSWSKTSSVLFCETQRRVLLCRMPWSVLHQHADSARNRRDVQERTGQDRPVSTHAVVAMLRPRRDGPVYRYPGAVSLTLTSPSAREGPPQLRVAPPLSTYELLGSTLAKYAQTIAARVVLSRQRAGEGASCRGFVRRPVSCSQKLTASQCAPQRSGGARRPP